MTVDVISCLREATIYATILKYEVKEHAYRPIQKKIAINQIIFLDFLIKLIILSQNIYIFIYLS